jgi:hypothetical protein
MKCASNGQHVFKVAVLVQFRDASHMHSFTARCPVYTAVINNLRGCERLEAIVFKDWKHSWAATSSVESLNIVTIMGKPSMNANLVISIFTHWPLACYCWIINVH